MRSENLRFLNLGGQKSVGFRYTKFGIGDVLCTELAKELERFWDYPLYPTYKDYKDMKIHTQWKCGKNLFCRMHKEAGRL